MLSFTAERFPRTSEVKRASNLPWGCALNPFAPPPVRLARIGAGGDGTGDGSKHGQTDRSSNGGQDAAAGTTAPLPVAGRGDWPGNRDPFHPVVETNSVAAVMLARCGDCSGYINPYICWNNSGQWTCPLCMSQSMPSSVAPSSSRDPAAVPSPAERYARASARPSLPELNTPAIDMPFHPRAGAGVQATATSPPTSPAAFGTRTTAAASSASVQPQPVYIALVDTTGSLEAMAVIRAGVLAAFESLPPQALFCLLTFDHQLGAFDLKTLVRLSVIRKGLNAGLGDEHAARLRDPMLDLSTAPAPQIAFDDSELSVPHVRYIRLDTDPRLPSTQLEDLFSVESLMVPVGECQAAVNDALETLPSISGLAARPLDPTAGPSLTMPASTPRRTIPALASVLDMLVRFKEERSSKQEALKPEFFAHLMLFTCGPPTDGPGSEPAPPAPAQHASLSYLRSHTTAFQAMAAKAVSTSTTVDLFILDSDSTHLANMTPLSVLTGGVVHTYPSLASCTLPQDVYRRLSLPRAMNAQLRIRCSTELQLSHTANLVFGASGRVDAQLLQLVGCDQFRTIPFDIDFRYPAEGLTKQSSLNGLIGIPTLQVAFLYHYCASKTDVVRGARPLIEQRLRLCTVQMPIARDLDELYHSMHEDVVMWMITQKMLLASIQEGIQAARSVLCDWLVVLQKNYYLHIQNTRGLDAVISPSSTTPESDRQVEALHFPFHVALDQLPRLVYGLLRGPLLHPNPASTDRQIAAHVAVSTLPCHLAKLTMYPGLLLMDSTQSFSPSPRRLSSNFAAVQDLQPPACLVVDTLTSILVVICAPPQQENAGRVSTLSLLPSDGTACCSESLLRSGICIGLTWILFDQCVVCHSSFAYHH
ncbi:hypothetical protein, variant 1 [Capsaspora owczarzaki ATCC 30864]|uniref:Sec23/Sec24 trunk domain-containing protein n=2 Tax=Capsaspora owczarzaki (strain ATCC 30864) TaxID=595528 RepID=A0A0D2VFZ4_CAPO3|nr:hypothetical protein, variant 1 [Capsaspora owczarzaki ATCC 30864]